MNWYKRSSVLKEAYGFYFLSTEELGRIFSSLWLKLIDAKKYKDNHTIICHFSSPKLEGNMLLGSIKELENKLQKINGVTSVKSKLFDYTVEILFDKEIVF